MTEPKNTWILFGIDIWRNADSTTKTNRIIHFHSKAAHWTSSQNKTQSRNSRLPVNKQRDRGLLFGSNKKGKYKIYLKTVLRMNANNRNLKKYWWKKRIHKGKKMIKIHQNLWSPVLGRRCEGSSCSKKDWTNRESWPTPSEFSSSSMAVAWHREWNILLTNAWQAMVGPSWCTAVATCHEEECGLELAGDDEVPQMEMHQGEANFLEQS